MSRNDLMEILEKVAQAEEQKMDLPTGMDYIVNKIFGNDRLTLNEIDFGQFELQDISATEELLNRIERERSQRLNAITHKLMIAEAAPANQQFV